MRGALFVQVHEFMCPKVYTLLYDVSCKLLNNYGAGTILLQQYSSVTQDTFKASP